MPQAVAFIDYFQMDFTAITRLSHHSFRHTDTLSRDYIFAGYYEIYFHQITDFTTSLASGRSSSFSQVTRQHCNKRFSSHEGLRMFP
jgi:hypothetical protein